MASALRKIFGIAYSKQEDKEHESDEAAGKKRRRCSIVDKTGQSGQVGWSSEGDCSGVSDETNPVNLLKQPSPKLSGSKKQRLGNPRTDPSNKLSLEQTPQKVTLRLEHCDFDNGDLNYGTSPSEVESDVDSVSEFDTSFEIDKSDVQLCRKVSKTELDDEFSDIEDRNDDQRLGLLLSYQMRIEKIERLLKSLLTEFQFHIEVSKIFCIKSHLTTLPGTAMGKVSKMLGTVKQIECLSRGESPTGSWNLVVEKEDTQSKLKVKDQLLNVKCFIQDFVDTHLNKPSELRLDVPTGNSTMTEKFDIKTQGRLQIPQVRYRVNRRKYERKMHDFPDLREILHNMFMLEDSSMNKSISENNVTTLLSDVEEPNTSQCTCNCKEHSSHSAKSSDSGLPAKQSDTISSSIGDFTLDNSQLTAYSESLQQILSYDSFCDTNLISSMLQKSAIERIAFYVRVHNIRMSTEQDNHETHATSAQSSKFHQDDLSNLDQFTVTPNEVDTSCKEENLNMPIDTRSIFFICTACHFNTMDEKGQEIQPSTVLNSMTMYRDDNKIVCFGENKFACSLCLLNGIVGESVLMSHCQGSDHVDRKNKLGGLFDHTEEQ